MEHLNPPPPCRLGRPLGRRTRNKIQIIILPAISLYVTPGRQTFLDVKNTKIHAPDNYVRDDDVDERPTHTTERNKLNKPNTTSARPYGGDYNSKNNKRGSYILSRQLVVLVCFFFHFARHLSRTAQGTKTRALLLHA